MAILTSCRPAHSTRIFHAIPNVYTHGPYYQVPTRPSPLDAILSSILSRPNLSPSLGDLQISAPSALTKPPSPPTVRTHFFGTPTCIPPCCPSIVVHIHIVILTRPTCFNPQPRTLPLKHDLGQHRSPLLAFSHPLPVATIPSRRVHGTTTCLPIPSV